MEAPHLVGHGLQQLVLAATEGPAASEHLNTLRHAQAKDDSSSLLRTSLLPHLLASSAPYCHSNSLGVHISDRPRFSSNSHLKSIQYSYLFFLER